MSIRKRTWISGGEKKTAWVVDYKDQKGERHLKTHRTKKAAEAWQTDTLYKVREGTHTPDSASPTVAEAADLWLNNRAVEGVERSTLRQYRSHVDLHINPLIGGVKLSMLTAPGVEDFKDKLLETKSRAMARKILTSLKSLISEARRRGLVSQNVAREVKFRTLARHKEPVVIPSKAEVQAMLKTVGEKWRPLIVTAVFTGMRASELRGLAWADVDLDAKVIKITRRADRWNDIGSPKSAAGRRDIPMTPMVVNALKEWKLACPKSDKDLVFPTGRGTVESLANIYNRGFAPLQVACGITIDTGKVDEEGKPIMRARYGLHALRHFYASWLIEQNFPPKRVQTILGHSTITMTYDTYGHLFPAPDDDNAKLAAGEIALVG